MQIPNNEQPKHKSFQMPIYLALGALCALLAVLAGRDDFSLEKFLQVACNASKTSLNLLNVSSDRLSCQTQKVRADFSINPPFGRDKAGQFWYDIPSNQWLTWGSSNEPEDEFVINVAWKKTPDEYSGNLRQGLRNMNRFRHGKVQVGTYYKVSNVHGGMFELLPFSIVIRD